MSCVVIYAEVLITFCFYWYIRGFVILFWGCNLWPQVFTQHSTQLFTQCSASWLVSESVSWLERYAQHRKLRPWKLFNYLPVTTLVSINTTDDAFLLQVWGVFLYISFRSLHLFSYFRDWNFRVNPHQVHNLSRCGSNAFPRTFSPNFHCLGLCQSSVIRTCQDTSYRTYSNVGKSVQSHLRSVASTSVVCSCRNLRSLLYASRGTSLR